MAPLESLAAAAAATVALPEAMQAGVIKALEAEAAWLAGCGPVLHGAIAAPTRRSNGASCGHEPATSEAPPAVGEHVQVGPAAAAVGKVDEVTATIFARTGGSGRWTRSIDARGEGR